MVTHPDQQGRRPYRRTRCSPAPGAPEQPAGRTRSRRSLQRADGGFARSGTWRVQDNRRAGNLSHQRVLYQVSPIRLEHFRPAWKPTLHSRSQSRRGRRRSAADTDPRQAGRHRQKAPAISLNAAAHPRLVPKRRSRRANSARAASKCGLVEVGPQHVQKHQFGISGLPEQEIGQALLAGGADDQVGVGHPGSGEEVAIERLSSPSSRGIEPVGPSRPRRRRRGGGGGDFGPRAIGQGDRQVLKSGLALTAGVAL